MQLIGKSEYAQNEKYYICWNFHIATDIHKSINISDDIYVLMKIMNECYDEVYVNNFRFQSLFIQNLRTLFFLNCV